MRFPVVSGEDLLGRRVTLPGELAGELNVVLIAFQRWQQELIDSWLPMIGQLEATHPGMRHCELPVLARMNPLARAFINGGMRAGIPDPAVRGATITVYGDKAAFRQALNLAHEDDILVVLIDRQGQVLWQAAGIFSTAKGQGLAEAAAALTPRPV